MKISILYLMDKILIVVISNRKNVEEKSDMLKLLYGNIIYTTKIFRDKAQLE